MDKETLLALIDLLGGPKHVLGFRFANGYKVVFSSHILAPDEDLIDVNGTEFLIYEHQCSTGRVAKSYLVLGEVKQVYTLDDIENLEGVILREIME